LSKFSPSQSNKRAKREVFLSRHLRESQREGERRREKERERERRERESHPVVGATLSHLSLSFSFLFFSLPQTKKTR
jgi:hypothetical protein